MNLLYVLLTSRHNLQQCHLVHFAEKDQQQHLKADDDDTCKIPDYYGSIQVTKMEISTELLDCD